MTMVALEAHQARVLELAGPLDRRLVPLDAAAGLALADDLHAKLPLPPFDNSAMDGYAIRAADAADGSLEVVGDGAAGAGLPPDLVPGQAARIMTGAPVPPGADTVVQVEFTDRASPRVTITAPITRGGNIRRAGEDLGAGEVAARAGDPLTPGRIALLSSLGYAALPVHRRPVVSVLATGSELTKPGIPLAPGSIYESNATMLAALLVADGAEVSVLPHVRDDPAEAIAALRDAAASSDLLVTAGGISAGDFEVVKQSLQPTGTVEFGPVAISPGRPQGWGRIGSTPVICLPGNPGSALVSYLLFGAPLVRRLLGRAQPRPPWIAAVTAEDFVGREGRTQLALGRLGDDGVRRAGPGHLLSTLAAADCLVRLDPGAQHGAGSGVPILLL
jgi:molybdopterin molybdotransferase